jgi:hypothetical protein
VAYPAAAAAKALARHQAACESGGRQRRRSIGGNRQWREARRQYRLKSAAAKKAMKAWPSAESSKASWRRQAAENVKIMAKIISLCESASAKGESGGGEIISQRKPVSRRH